MGTKSLRISIRRGFGALYAYSSLPRVGTLSVHFFVLFHGSGGVRATGPDPRGLKASWPDPTRPDPTRPMIFQTPADPTPLDPRDFENPLT